MEEILQAKTKEKNRRSTRRIFARKKKGKEERRPKETRTLGVGGKGKPSGQFPDWC